jgi:hypothetical protein
MRPQRRSRRRVLQARWTDPVPPEVRERWAAEHELTKARLAAHAAGDHEEAMRLSIAIHRAIVDQGRPLDAPQIWMLLGRDKRAARTTAR